MKLKQRILLSVVTWAWLLPPAAYAAVPEPGWLYLPGMHGEVPSVNGALEVMADDKGLEVFDAMEKYLSGDFRFVEDQYVEHNDRGKKLWAVVPLRISELNQKEWVLWFDGQTALDLKMWLLDMNLNVVEHYHTGSAYPYHTRPVDERRFAMPFALGTQGEFYAVFLMKLPGPSVVGLNATTADELLEISSNDAFIRAIYLGLAVMMVMYSLFLTWVMRRKEYVVYVFYVACIMLAPIGNSELPHRYLWPSAGEFNIRIPFFTSLFSGFVAALFIAQLLELKSQSTRLWRLFQASMLISVVAACLVPFVEYDKVVIFSTYWGAMLSVLLVSVCLDRAIRGSVLARLLSCGWVSQLLGIGIFVAHQRGVLAEVGWLDYSFLIGSSLEMIFFSLAIPVGLGSVMRDKDEMLAELEFVSVRYEEALMSVTNAEAEIKSLSKLLEQEHYDLERLTLGYDRALASLGKAEQKLAQAEKLASLGQLIVGISDDLGVKAGSVLRSGEEISRAIDRLISSIDARESLEEPEGSELTSIWDSMRRMLVFLEKGAHSIQRMNKALSHYAGGEDEEITILGLADVCDDIRLIVHGRIRQHRFEQDVPSELNITARRSDIERVLGNLLTNASDAISDLPPELQADEELGIIRLSAKKVEHESKEWVVIEVEDTGGGIADERRDEVRLPFMTTKTLQRGTGLGLFTADSILREHGGHMAIGSSESLGGAKISLWFPVLT